MKRGTLVFQATPDPAPDGGGKPDERPAWLPENFKAPEDLAKAYDEARREMSRAQTERDQERQQFAAALEAMESRQTPVTPANGDPHEAEWIRAIEAGDAATAFRTAKEAAAAESTSKIEKLLEEKLGNIQPVLDQQQQAQREASIRMAEDVVMRALPEGQYKELLPEISKSVQEHPHYLPAQSSVEGYAAAILDVVKLVQHDKLAEQVKSLEQERADKLAAQTVNGAGRPSVFSEDQQKAEFERIKNTATGSFAELMARQRSA